MNPNNQESHNQDQQEEEEEDQRMNFYQIIKSYREDGENPPASRLLYAAYFNESLIQSQNIDLEKIMEQRTKDKQREKELFQGYCLLKGVFQLHLLEGDSATINEFMLGLYNDFNKEKSIYLNLNIICFSEDNSTKMFDKWYCDNMFQPGPQLSTDIEKTDQQVQDRTWEIYNMICQAGKKHASKGVKDKLQKKIAQEINISVDDMCLAISKYYMSINDYYNMYLSDIQIDLDGEKQYPYQPSLISILEFESNGNIGQNY